MKGWFGNKVKHSLASKGIKTVNKFVNPEKQSSRGIKTSVKKSYKHTDEFDKFMFEEFEKNKDIDVVEIKNDIEWIFKDVNGTTLNLMMYSDLNGDINLQKIDALPTGTGLGSRVINIIKTYADKNSKTVYANDVENEGFCKSIGFEEVIIDDVKFEPMYEGEVKDFKFYKYEGGS